MAGWGDVADRQDGTGQPQPKPLPPLPSTTKVPAKLVAGPSGISASGRKVGGLAPPAPDSDPANGLAATGPSPAAGSPAGWERVGGVVAWVGSIASVGVALIGAGASFGWFGDGDRGEGALPIRSPESVLLAGEDEVGRYLATLTDRGIEVTIQDLSCWFAHPGGEAGPEDQLWCGAVAFADSEDGSSWLHVPLSLREDGDWITAEVGEIESRRTYALPAKLELRRLERDRRLSTADTEPAVGRPGVGAAPPVAAGVVPDEDVMVALSPLDSEPITAVGRAARVYLSDAASGRGEIVAASSGEEWLLVQFAAFTNGGRQAEVVVGGVHHRTIEREDDGVVAVSVPAGEEDIVLIVDGISVDV